MAGSAALEGMGLMVLGLGRRQLGLRVVFIATVLTFAAFTGVAGLATSLGVPVGAVPRRYGADRQALVTE